LLMLPQSAGMLARVWKTWKIFLSLPKPYKIIQSDHPIDSNVGIVETSCLKWCSIVIVKKVNDSENKFF
jgi:hypothetical protein